MKKKQSPMPSFKKWLMALGKEIIGFFIDLPWGMTMLFKIFYQKFKPFLKEVRDFFVDLPIGIKGIWRIFVEKTANFRKNALEFIKETPEGLKNMVLYYAAKMAGAYRNRSAKQKERNAVKKKFKQEEKNLKKASGKTKKGKTEMFFYRLASTVIITVLSFQMLLLTVFGIFVGYNTFFVGQNDVKLVVASAKAGSNKYKEESINMSSKVVYPYGSEKMYIDFTFIAEKLSLSSFSDGKKVRYTCADGKMLVVTLESNCVMIDGSILILPGAAFEKDGRVYLPLNILTEYAENVTVSYDPEKDKLIVFRSKDEELSGYTQVVFKDLTFTAQGIKPAPIPEVIEGTGTPGVTVSSEETSENIEEV